MVFESNMLVRIVIFVLAVIGFFIARHIYTHKQKGKALVCPMRFDCNAVVHSDYSKFLGIPLEVLGMFYYGAASLFYAYLILHGEMSTPLISLAVALALGAFLMSVYLLLIQIFVLRKGCFWCAVSAFLSILIFVCTCYAYGFISIVMNYLK